ncbi:MAG: copper oxidase [Nitrospira sp.]|nr:MAG: copper oxidase [Nitrospira sp.]
MKYLQVALLMTGLMLGARDLALAEQATVNFDVTDIPGYWFDTGNQIVGTRSLAIINPGDKVTFTQNDPVRGRTSESLHTVTSLIFPAAAVDSEKLDQSAANFDNFHVTLKTPGLYVFVCKVHPYMLGGVIVDDPNTTTVNKKGETVPAFDIGNAQGGANDLHLEGVGDFPSNSNLGLRLLRAFFVVTSPSNWKDYTKVGLPYKPAYPPVPVALTGGAVVQDLNEALQTTFDGETIPPPKRPRINGVGEVWVDSQYELTDRKGPKFPGTISVVEVGSFFPDRNWKVKRKIALPHQKMNNGHNMWASHNQRQIYQTEWHGASLFVIDRLTGRFMQEINVGEDPAHVMTRVDTQQVHVSLNGEDGVMELDRNRWGFLRPHRVISMQDPDPNKKSDPTQPHAHWMGFDGKTMATPNANTADSSLFDFEKDEVVSKLFTGGLPIAAAMMPDSSKYYVSNYLSHTTSVIDMKANPPVKIKDINLLQNYNPITGAVGGNGAIGGLPIQTPVSPDGKFVITGNTLTGTITIIDTKTDTLVKSLICDPGCHGVNFGAKRGGGYYAYVTSKFANRLIVLDYDPNRDGDASDAEIAGWVVLDNDNVSKDDAITKVEGNRGQGGQGVLPVPNVYNGWVQKLPAIWKVQLTHAQRHPFPQAENADADAHDDDHE